ncbi:hypothetical protein [Microcoleus sp.]|uniref:hypothetical protein n=1 Tax=Microcoleus sp. TaxID=44472 RepID=UPI0035265D04
MCANAGDRASISPEAIASKIVEEAKTRFLPPRLFLYNLAKALMPHAPYFDFAQHKCPMPHTSTSLSTSAPLPIT